MSKHLKERLVGALVLVIMSIIFIPMFLKGPIESEITKKANNKNASKERLNFSSRSVIIIPKKQETNTSLVRGRDSTNSKEFNKKPNKVLNEKNIDNYIKKTAKKEHGERKKLDNKKNPLWVVQLGSFSSKNNADKLNLRLQKKGFLSFIETIKSGNKTIYKVRIKAKPLKKDAEFILNKIKTELKLDGLLLKVFLE